VLRTLGEIYVTLAPPILAGILNMAWVKTPWLRRLARPIDGGLTLPDGQRVFGDNKTWKGLLGMVVLGALAGLLLGLLERGTAAEGLNLFYREHADTNAWSTLVGALLGLGYTLAELPNSFVKRRLGISPGRPPEGAAKGRSSSATKPTRWWGAHWSWPSSWASACPCSLRSSWSAP